MAFLWFLFRSHPESCSFSGYCNVTLICMLYKICILAYHFFANCVDFFPLSISCSEIISWGEPHSCSMMSCFEYSSFPHEMRNLLTKYQERASGRRQRCFWFSLPLKKFAILNTMLTWRQPISPPCRCVSEQLSEPETWGSFLCCPCFFFSPHTSLPFGFIHNDCNMNEEGSLPHPPFVRSPTRIMWDSFGASLLCFSMTYQPYFYIQSITGKMSSAVGASLPRKSVPWYLLNILVFYLVIFYFPLVLAVFGKHSL